jgi:hypothetical protein
MLLEVLALPLLRVASVATPFNFPASAFGCDDQDVTFARGLRCCVFLLSLLGFSAISLAPFKHLFDA